MSGTDVVNVDFDSGGQRVVGRLHLPSKLGALEDRVVVTSHGLMSSKDSQKYLEVADLFSSKGIAVLRFDFRGSGQSEGSGNLISDRILDLKAAVNFVTRKGFESIGVLGSSYGGSTAILVASQTANIRAVVTWATPCYLTDLFRSMVPAEASGNSAHSDAKRKEADSSRFLSDLAEHDVAEAAKSVSRIFVVHCKGDKVIPSNQAEVIYNTALQPKKMKIFEDGDHQFTDHSTRRQAIQLSLEWFVRHL